MVQHKVRKAAQFAKFCDMCEALEEFDIDYGSFLDWLRPALEEFVREKTMPKKIAKVDLDQDKTALLTEWKKAHDELELLKSKEAQLRTKLVADNFTGTKLEGVETIDIGWGWRLKATKNLNISATNESQQTVTLLNALGEIDPTIATNLVRWKPDISTKVYRDLLALADANPPLKALMAAAITVKPGMPELEMIPPKPEPAPSDVVIIDASPAITDGSNIKW